MHKPYILFQTDFGVGGGASMYGMCKLVDPSLRSGELSHTVPTFQVAEGSRRLAGVMTYWPKGTIFISVVDPGVGTPRRACIARTANGYYVTTPDNGTLTAIHQRYGITEIREIDETINRYPHTPKVSIFHGRDLFAYCAARLAAGIISYEQVGLAYPLKEMVLLDENGKDTLTGRESETDDLASPGFKTVSGEPSGPAFGSTIIASQTACEKMPPIMVANDFNHDGRLAIMRGISQSMSHTLAVYDLPLCSLDRDVAAVMVENYQHWPKGSVLTAAVGLAEAERKGCAIAYARTATGQWIVAPDNGFFERVATQMGLMEIKNIPLVPMGWPKLSLSDYEPGHTLMIQIAYCAANLAMGMKPSSYPVNKDMR